MTILEVKFESNVNGIIKSVNKKMQIGSSKDLNDPNGTMKNIEGYKKDHREA